MTIRAWFLGVVLFPIVAWPADRTSLDQPSGAASTIRRLREQSNAAIGRHDTSGIAESFAPGVVVVTSTSSVTVGRDENARAFAERFKARPDVVYRRTPAEVRVFGPWRMASERGAWVGRWTEADGKITIGGSYFAKWREIQGQWRIESETYVPEQCSGGSYCSKEP